MSRKKQDRERLALWQKRLSVNEIAMEERYARMDDFEKKYRGTRELAAAVQWRSDKGGGAEEALHVRNVVAELIEAQVDSGLPQPKVTAKNEGDEHLAQLIEDMLRNEMDRLPFEMMNDQAARTVPIQGGGYYLVDWDNTERSHTTIGELLVSFYHPKMVVPQDGVWTSVEDMSYVFLRLPETKDYIKARYGVDVEDESESNPEVRGVEADGSELTDDLVTLNIAYFRNKSGGIGRYVWVNDIELEYLEDYQARRTRKCENCGHRAPADGEELPQPDYSGMQFGGLANTAAIALSQPPGESKDICPECGGKYVESSDDFEELQHPIMRSDSSVIDLPVEVYQLVQEDGTVVEMAEQVPLQIPFYKPDMFPLVLQRNISIYGQLLGDSDIAKIEDQQNTINHLAAKLNDKLLSGGSYMVLPKDAVVSTTADELKAIWVDNIAEANIIRAVSTTPNDVEAVMAAMNQSYEQARQTIGITNSFQGREDSTATSGRAKAISAQQAAGRLQSKRITKNAAWADMFQLMFKFKLAYTDEVRPVIAADRQNNQVYKSFNRYDFLKQDAAGLWYWNDEFLFSVDDSSALATNREAMWQETMQNLQMGAYGDPTQTETLIMYWSKMERLHYPGAGETKAELIEKQERQQQMMQQQMQMQQMQQQAAAGGGMMPQQQMQPRPEQAAVQQILGGGRSR